MRLAAVVLVLLAGAVAILILANTLNSLLLGGLIGGFAALLISIPISLIIFSYFTRRHNEQIRAEIRTELANVQAQALAAQEIAQAAYDAEGYVISSEQDEDWNGEDEQTFRESTERNYGARRYPRLPAAGQSRATTTAHQHAIEFDEDQKTRTSELSRRPQQGRRTSSDPGRSFRSQHQTAALRAARQEMIQQYEEETGLMAPPSKKLPVPRPSRQTPSQGPRHYRPGQTVNSQPPRPSTSRRLLSTGSEHIADLPTQAPKGHEPKTEQFRSPYPRLRSTQQHQSTQTGRTSRNPQAGEEGYTSEHTSGTLKNPLVRRAPYMYEDDPLRQQLSQQLEPPAVRRSSLYEDEGE